MLTKPPLTPSKDALRVLRQLAFAGSTIATVGVVTVNYNVCRQIRLAEQILETKRQIRAISNGNRDAFMARVIEAAESGQDFSLRAMREQRNRERYLDISGITSAEVQGSTAQHFDCPRKVPDNGETDISSRRAAQKIRRVVSSTTSAEGQGSTDKEIDGEERLHEDAESYISRQKEAHKIRRVFAEVKSLSQSRRWRSDYFTPTTRSWAIHGCAELAEPEILTAVKHNHVYCGNREEAADRIRKATMAMTSTARAPVYGRPRKVVPAAQLKLHKCVAALLGTPFNFQTTPAIEISSSTASATPSALMTNRVKFSTTDGSCYVVGAKDQTVQRTGEDEIDHRNASLADEFPANSVIRQNRQQYVEESNQSPSCMLFEGATRSRTHVGANMTSRNNVSSISSVGARSYTTSSAYKSRSPNSDLGNSSSGATQFEFDLQSVKSGDALLLFQDKQEKQPPLPTLALSTVPEDCNEVNPRSIPTSGSATKFEAYSGSSTHAIEERMIRKPYHGIGLENSTNMSLADFVPWPNLESMDESRQLDKRQKDEEDVQARGLEKHDGQHEVTRKWTPFPRSFQTSEGYGSAHDEAISNVQRLPKPELTVSPRSLEVPERVVGTRDTQRDSTLQASAERTFLQTDLRDSGATLNDRVREASSMPVMTEEERIFLTVLIRNAFSSDGRIDGQRAWKIAALQRLQQNDVATVDFLYTEFVEKGIMKLSPRYHIVQTLVQWYYEHDKYSARAAQILFPNLDIDRNDHTVFARDKTIIDHSPMRENINKSLSASRFLQGLWEERADAEWLVFNFRRVIVAAKLRGVELVEELFALMIRFLASVGDMPTAQALYDEMVFYHQIEASFLSRTLLLRGYARIGDWYRVEREIEAMHSLGLSRTRPHGYALMVNAVLQEYAARLSIGQFHNFLINAISYWGLMPTSAITTTTVQMYLSHQRYDLIREWMETLQMLFPKIETETSVFQWLLSNFWQRAESNCQDIEQAIKAVVYRNPSTKLKSYALNMIHEALSRDLAVKLEAARAKTRSHRHASQPLTTAETDYTSAKTLDEYLASAFAMAASSVAPNSKPAPEVMDLHRQATAVQRVNTFLTSSNTVEALDEFISSEPDPDTVNSDPSGTIPDKGLNHLASSLYHLRDSIPTLLTSEFLPETKTIITAIREFYRNRFTSDLPTDHTLFLWVCEKLLHADRAFDAIFVIEQVYRDRLVRQLAGLDPQSDQDGGDISSNNPSDVSKTSPTPRRDRVVPFQMPFFEFWMWLAGMTRSRVQWIRVVEEVLHLSTPVPAPFPSQTSPDHHTSPHRQPLQVTSTFIFLARNNAVRVLKNRWEKRFHTRKKRRAPLDEVTWLVHRLHARREMQIGRSELEDSKFVGPGGRAGKHRPFNLVGRLV